MIGDKVIDMGIDGKMFPTRQPLALAIRMRVVDILNKDLANISDLASQVKQVHWNMKGPLFISIHRVLDDMYGTLLDYIDTIAERNTALGGQVTGTIRMASSSTQLPEMELSTYRDMDCINALVERFSIVSRGLLSSIDVIEGAGDRVTSNILQEMAHGIDKYMWFLEAHIQS